MKFSNFVSDTLCVASEGGVASNSKRSTDNKSRADGHMGDPGPVCESWLFQRTIDKKAVVMAYKGWRDGHTQHQSTADGKTKRTNFLATFLEGLSYLQSQFDGKLSVSLA